MLIALVNEAKLKQEKKYLSTVELSLEFVIVEP